VMQSVQAHIANLSCAEALALFPGRRAAQVASFCSRSL
jgi:hypothetical protein